MGWGASQLRPSNQERIPQHAVGCRSLSHFYLLQMGQGWDCRAATQSWEQRLRWGHVLGPHKALLLPGHQLWSAELVGLFPWWRAEIIATEGAPCLELILPPPPWERLKNMARPLQPRLHNPKSFVLCLSDLVRRKR